MGPDTVCSLKTEISLAIPKSSILLSWMCTIIHLLNGHLLIPHYVIGTVVGTLGMARNKLEISHCPGAYVSDWGVRY